MFCNAKKRESQQGNGEQIIDFCWVIFIGLKLGYTEKEIKHMRYGKWSDLFITYQQMHDFGDKNFDVKEKKVHSLMEL